MNITCRQCKTLLRRSVQQKKTAPDYIAAPWYRDAAGALHMALACLHCGIVHDCIGAQRPAIFTSLLSPLKINMVKVVATVSPGDACWSIPPAAPCTDVPGHGDALDHEHPPIPDSILAALHARGLCTRDGGKPEI
ncbi:hypothetical protein [Desulfonatronum thioautotrophicum]|uniref:hypothetical protein n=1 Tax=Desulfonatronum thioautotrophicum TaxID=617001 RepID=UPI0005EB12CF|nr:hypothetical protein [Desulfonatronum thioautotrophicum]